MYAFCTSKTLVCFHPVMNATQMSDHDAKAIYPPGGRDGSMFTILPKPGLQEVPDWVRDTATFRLAEKAGHVTEVVRAKPVPAAGATVEPAADNEPELVGTAVSGVSKQPVGAVSATGRRK